MRMLLRPHRPFLVLCFAVACGGEPTESATRSADTGDGSGDDASVTDGVTLNPTGSADGDPSSGDTDAQSTGDPSTGDPSAEDSGTSDTGSGEAESSSASGDDTSSGSTDTGSDVDDSVYDVQDGTLAEGTPVAIDGVVVTGVASNGLFVQEPPGGQFSGVFVFSLGDPDISAAVVGDVVNVTGVTLEYLGITEVDMTAGTFEIVGSGPPLTAETIEASVLGDDVTAEPWECVLVRIEGDLEVVLVAMSNEFVVDARAVDVRIDDYLYEAPTSGDFVGFDVGATFTAIQGPLNYLNDEFKIAVRGALDLSGYAAP